MPQQITEQQLIQRLEDDIQASVQIIKYTPEQLRQLSMRPLPPVLDTLFTNSKFVAMSDNEII